MELTCARCSARYRAAVELPLLTAVRVICPSCGKTAVLRPSTERGTTPLPPRPARAVIADEPREFRDFLARELEAMGFEVTLFDNAHGVFDFVESTRAQLVVLNVYLKGGQLGVDICEKIKDTPELSGTRVVLIGALFRANRFRANPTNLYGADEYIEEQIPAKELRQIVRELFPSTPALAAHDTPQHEEARRLARLILSDIVIYHTDKVDDGIREGTFFEVLAGEIAEGREYYDSRVPAAIRQHTDFFTETLDQFVRMKREELGGGERRADRK